MGCGGGVGLSLIARVGAVGGACVLLAQCSQVPGGKLDPKYGVSSSPRLVALGEPVPKGGGTYRVGKPYTIGGRTYEPEENANYSAEGLASWYGEDFHGRATANGEVYDMASISAAHPTLPIPSYARVTNLDNQKSIIVRVNDRGPVSRGPADRRVGAHRAAARLLRPRRHPGAGRIRRPRRARRLRRHQARGDLAERHAGAGSVARSGSRRRGRSCRNRRSRSRGAVPMPADRPFELGHDDDRRPRRQAPAASEVAAISRQPIAPVAAQPRTVAMAPANPSPKPGARPRRGCGIG